MADLISRWHVISEDFLNYVDGWKDHVVVNKFVDNFIVFILCVVSRLSSDTWLKQTILEEIVARLDAQLNLMKED